MRPPWADDLGDGVMECAKGCIESFAWEPTECLCGHHGANIIATHDRFGLPVPVLRCEECYTMRAGLRPEADDLVTYYHGSSPAFLKLHPGQAMKGDDLYRRQAEIATKASGLGGGVFVEIGQGPQGGCGRFMGAEFAGLRSGRCDLVMAHHILEHVADPVSQLRQWARRLTDGGRLVVTVPNTDHVRTHRLVAKYGMDAWWTFDHLWHWTLSTIRQPFELEGLDVTTVSILSPGMVSHVGSLLVVARRNV